MSGFSPAIESGRTTFSSASSMGRRLKNWKTKPMCSRRRRVSCESSSSRDLGAGDHHRPRGGLVEAGEDVHEGRLAGAGRAHHGHELAGADLEIDAAERVDGGLAFAVAAREVARLDRGVRGHGDAVLRLLPHDHGVHARRFRAPERVAYSDLHRPPTEVEADDGRHVRDDEERSLPAARPAVPHDRRGDDRGARHREELAPAERERQVVREEEGEERHHRDDEQRDLGARGDGDLAGEPHLPVARDDDRAAVLGCVADDRHDHDGDEELAQADGRREGVQRVDEDLAHPGRRAGRHGESGERSRQRPGALARVFALASRLRWRRRLRPTTAR